MPDDKNCTTTGASSSSARYILSTEQRAYGLVIVYGMAAILLVLYFLREDSCIHKSRRVENAYIIVCLALVQIFGEVFVGDHFSLFESLRGDDPSLGNAVKLKSILRLLLFLHIIHFHATLRKHPAYSRQYPTRRRQVSSMHYNTVPKQPGHGYHAIRVAEEIETLLEDIVARSTHASWVSTLPLPEIMYATFMLMDVLFLFGPIAERLRKLLDSARLALVIYSLWYILRRVCRFSLRQEFAKLHGLVEILVHMRDKDTLEDVLMRVSVANLVMVVDWKTVLLLTQTAVRKKVLTTLSKSILLDALQKKGFQAKQVGEEARRLILSCFGEELTQLKNSVDEGGDYHNLYKLVYTDIKDADIRAEILRHLSTEAQDVRRRLGKALGVKILSDMDDTLHSSGGHFPAGCDARYPRNTVYPGCLSLFRVLDRMDPSWDPQAPCCNLVFLSARPHIYKDYAEELTYKRFKKLHTDGLLHSMPTLLAGKLQTGLWAMARYFCLGAQAWKQVGDFKFDIYRAYRELYLEYDFVFFGDNGQGDLWAGQRMAEQEAIRSGRHWSGLESPLAARSDEPQLLGVLIHRVMPEERCLSRAHDCCFGHASPHHAPAPEGCGMEESPTGVPRIASSWVADHVCYSRVFLHGSYVGAALALHRRDPNLVSAEDLAMIAAEAVEEFDRMRLVYAEWGTRWEAAERDLRIDIEEAQRVVAQAGVTVGSELEDEVFMPRLEETDKFLADTMLIMPRPSLASSAQDRRWSTFTTMTSLLSGSPASLPSAGHRGSDFGASRSQAWRRGRFSMHPSLAEEEPSSSSAAAPPARPGAAASSAQRSPGTVELVTPAAAAFAAAGVGSAPLRPPPRRPRVQQQRTRTFR